MHFEKVDRQVESRVYVLVQPHRELVAKQDSLPVCRLGLILSGWVHCLPLPRPTERKQASAPREQFAAHLYESK